MGEEVPMGRFEADLLRYVPGRPRLNLEQMQRMVLRVEEAWEEAQGRAMAAEEARAQADEAACRYRAEAEAARDAQMRVYRRGVWLVWAQVVVCGLCSAALLVMLARGRAS